MYVKFVSRLALSKSAGLKEIDLLPAVKAEGDDSPVELPESHDLWASHLSASLISCLIGQQF